MAWSYQSASCSLEYGRQRLKVCDHTSLRSAIVYGETRLLMDQAGFSCSKERRKKAASGETFNIFTITKIERSEVNTHSAMIAELLYPRGNHAKESLFLKLLLSHIGISHS